MLPQISQPRQLLQKFLLQLSQRWFALLAKLPTLFQQMTPLLLLILHFILDTPLDIATLSGSTNQPMAVDGNIDLGTLVDTDSASWDRLKNMVSKLTDASRMQFLTPHSKPSSSDLLHSHLVTNQGKTWSVHIQKKWLDQFLWFPYSTVLSGGMRRYCIIFPKQLRKGGNLGAHPGALVLSP